MTTELQEYQINRNFIRPGDIVRCRPTTGGSFDAPVTRIFDNEGRIEIEVVGGRGGRKMFRTFKPEQIQRKKSRRQ